MVVSGAFGIGVHGLGFSSAKAGDRMRTRLEPCGTEPAPTSDINPRGSSNDAEDANASLVLNPDGSPNRSVGRS